MNCILFDLANCPVEGQVRKECASHPNCALTCNTTGPVVCPLVCIVDGCECPNGTVIDEAKNECVAPSECPGTYYMYLCMHMYAKIQASL